MCRQSSFRLLVGSIVLLSLFSACKRDSDTATVRIHLPDEPDKLQPFLLTSGYGRQVVRHVFLTLMDYDPKSYEYVPVLAKAPATVTNIDTGALKGGQAFTYEILDEAVWDNGKPVLASDYEFTLKMILNPKTGASRWRGFYENVQDFRIDPANPKKFTVLTKYYMLTEDALGSLYILPEYVYDPNGLLRGVSVHDLADPEVSRQLAETDKRMADFGAMAADAKYAREKDFVSGCGPYRLEIWETGQHVVLAKKPNWWGDKLAAQRPLLTARPEKLFYRILKDDAALMAEFKNGTMDAANNVKVDNFIAMKNDPQVNKLYNFYTPATLQYSYYGMNMKNPKLADKRVRRALAHLVNRDAIINNLLKGMGTPATGPVLSSSPFYNKQLAPIPFDVEKAKSLLAEAGWKDSNGDGTVDQNKVEMKLQLLFTPQGLGKDVALLFQENAKKAGVAIELVPKDLNGIKAELKKREFDLFAFGTATDLGNPDFYQDWHTASNTPDGSNRVGFGTPETDKLIEDIRDSRDPAQRKELYLRFQEILYDEQPFIFIVTPTDRVMVNKKFESFPTLRRTGFSGYVEESFAPK